MTDVDFTSIRALGEGQREAFEELCCQLARSDNEVPPGSTPRRFRGAGGDGGVEFLWVLPDGTKRGIQAKFFDDLGGKKAQLEGSFKQAIANHPELQRYTFCFPFQLGGPTGARASGRGRRRTSETEKLEGWISEWESFAASEGVELKIDWWDATELTDMLLASDPHGGRRLYWFNSTVLTDSWLEDHLEDATAQAGERYTPELSVEVPAVGALRAFGRDPAWQASLEERRKGLRETTESWARKLRPGGGPGPAVSEFPERAKEEAERLLELAVELESCLTEDSAVAWEELLGLLSDAIELALECERVTVEELQAQHGEIAVDSPGFRQWMAEYQMSFPAAHVDSARELLRELQATKQWVEGPSGTLPGADVLLVRGVAGVGKTHAIVDQALERRRDGRVSFVLFGEDFGTGDPWTTVAAKLGFGTNVGREELLGAIDAAAEATGATGVIYIDALNETRPDRRAWRKWLPTMARQIGRHGNLKLCVSCRDSYLEEVVPASMSLPEVEHNGFVGVEFEAIRRFFEHYGLERPSTPLMQPEFTVPLFLHLLCQSLQTLGETTLPPGMQGITRIVELFLSASNKRIAEEIDYDPLERRVQEAVRTLVDLMAEQRTRLPSWRDAKNRVDALYPPASRSASLFDQLARTDVLAIVSAPASGTEEPERMVRFTFERIADHLLASHLLDQVQPEEAASAFADDGPLAFSAVSDEQARAHRGLLEALAVQMPERFGFELTEVIDSVTWDETLMPAILAALPWRDPASVTPSTEHLVLSCLSRSEELLTSALESLLALSTRPSHPLNADKLDWLLRSIPLADRDGVWCWFLYRSYEEERGIHRIIDWALRDELEGLGREALRLWATTLAWFCAAADRRVRDKASKALVRVFLAKPIIIPSLIHLFADVDDDYVIERVLAAAYGTVLLAENETPTKLAAEAVWRAFFESEDLTLNALIRDHVRLILEVARDASVLPEGSMVERFRPPYDSSWPIEYPSEEETAPLEEREDLPYLTLNEFHSDFAKYRVRPRVVEAFDQDASAVHRWFLKNIVELGYPGHGRLCARYDVEMVRKYGNGRARRGWAERIGKKYYWILLQRLVGQLADHLPEKEYRDPLPIPSEPRLQGLKLRQIDPSDLRVFQRPERGTVPELYLKEDYDFRRLLDLPDQDWVTGPDFLNAPSLLEVEDSEGDAWLPLRLYKIWNMLLSDDPQDDYPKRSLTLQISSVLVTKERSADLYEALGKNSFRPDDLEVSIHEYDGGFFGEYPYGPAFSQRFETGELSSADRVWGIPVSLTTADLLRSAFKYDHSGSGDHALVVPVPPLTEGDRLRWDRNGGWVSPAGETVFWDPQNEADDRGLALLVRKDWLLELLDRKGLSLLWISYQWKLVHEGLLSSGDQHEQYGAIALTDGEIEPLGVGYFKYPEKDA